MAKSKKPKKTSASDTKSVLDDIRKKYGGESVVNMDGTNIKAYDVVSTGSLRLDDALGVGGMPRGRIAEIYGPESSGKTTMTLHMIADAQKQGLRCAFIDAEHALDISYAQCLGVDLDTLDLVQPDYGEQALEICDMMAQSGEYGLIVVDSVAALTPKAELEGEVGASHVGLQARMMGQALRKMTGACSRGGTLVVFINQIRHKIGVMFGSPETTPGGHALKYYASVRLDIRRIGSNKRGEEVVSNRTRVTVKKLKVAPPFKKVEFDISFGIGVDRCGELIELGVERGVIEKAGAFFKLDGQTLAQGLENTKEVLRDDDELRESLATRILEAK